MKITLLIIQSFQEHQLNSRIFPVFPGDISNSRRFPVVVDTLRERMHKCTRYEDHGPNENKQQWRQLAGPGFPGKWQPKWCMCC